MEISQTNRAGELRKDSEKQKGSKIWNLETKQHTSKTKWIKTQDEQKTKNNQKQNKTERKKKIPIARNFARSIRVAKMAAASQRICGNTKEWPLEHNKEFTL